MPFADSDRKINIIYMPSIFLHAQRRPSQQGQCPSQILTEKSISYAFNFPSCPPQPTIAGPIPLFFIQIIIVQQRTRPDLALLRRCCFHCIFIKSPPSKSALRRPPCQDGENALDIKEVLPCMGCCCYGGSSTIFMLPHVQFQESERNHFFLFVEL